MKGDLNELAEKRPSAADPSAAEQVSADTLPSIGRTFRAVLSVEGVLVPAVILGAAGYFIGWRYLRDYYGAFGLEISLLSFSVTDIVAAGWRIYFLMAMLILGAVFVVAALQSPLDHSLLKFGAGRLMHWFFVVVVLALVLILGVLFEYLFVYAALDTPLFYVLSVASLGMLLLAFVIGERIKVHLAMDKEVRGRSIRVFKLIFPHPWSWLFVIALGLIITLSQISSYAGLNASKRDRSPNGRLEIVSLYTEEPLPISGGLKAMEGGWIYSGLRLILRTDDMYYVFRPEEVKDWVTTTYAVPRQAVEHMQLKPWWDVWVHP